MPDLCPLVFADLDDTLFQSHRKTQPAHRHRQVSVAGNGDPRKAGFMTARQSALFDWLAASTEIIPVTARSGDAFSRVDLPFSSWAIISNGAVILEPGGSPHAPWAAKMTALLTPLADQMQDILTQGRDAAQAAEIDTRSWIVTEDGFATYVVFKLNVVTPDSLTRLHDLPLPAPGWQRHFNSETLALIPPGSGKLGAVTYLQTQLNPDGHRPTLGFGDSDSDLTFMRTTDVLMIPAASQIARRV